MWPSEEKSIRWDKMIDRRWDVGIEGEGYCCALPLLTHPFIVHHIRERAQRHCLKEMGAVGEWER